MGYEFGIAPGGNEDVAILDNEDANQALQAGVMEVMVREGMQPSVTLKTVPKASAKRHLAFSNMPSTTRASDSGKRRAFSATP